MGLVGVLCFGWNWRNKQTTTVIVKALFFLLISTKNVVLKLNGILHRRHFGRKQRLGSIEKRTQLAQQPSHLSTSHESGRNNACFKFLNKWNRFNNGPLLHQFPPGEVGPKPQDTAWWCHGLASIGPHHFWWTSSLLAAWSFSSSLFSSCSVNAL